MAGYGPTAATADDHSIEHRVVSCKGTAPRASLAHLPLLRLRTRWSGSLLWPRSFTVACTS